MNRMLQLVCPFRPIGFGKCFHRHPQHSHLVTCGANFGMVFPRSLFRATLTFCFFSFHSAFITLSVFTFGTLLLPTYPLLFAVASLLGVS